MLAGIAKAITGNDPFQAAPPPPPPPMWNTRLTQCDPPAQGSECALAFFCTHCLQAITKSKVDNTECCYNIMCWQPIATYSFVRNAYGIPGTCGDDMGYGLLCMCCETRQIATEARLRGPVPFRFGQKDSTWHVSLFDCTCCGFLQSVLFPMCVAHEVRSFLQPAVAPDTCFDCLCLIPFSMYGQARHQYNIISDCPLAEDILLPLVCYPCALNQARHEAQWQLQNAILIARAQAAAAAAQHPQQQQQQSTGLSLGGLFR